MAANIIKLERQYAYYWILDSLQNMFTVSINMQASDCFIADPCYFAQNITDSQLHVFIWKVLNKVKILSVIALFLVLLVSQFHREHNTPSDNCKIHKLIMRPLPRTYPDAFT